MKRRHRKHPVVSAVPITQQKVGSKRKRANDADTESNHAEDEPYQNVEKENGAMELSASETSNHMDNSREDLVGESEPAENEPDENEDELGEDEYEDESEQDGLEDESNQTNPPDDVAAADQAGIQRYGENAASVPPSTGTLGTRVKRKCRKRRKYTTAYMHKIAASKRWTMSVLKIRFCKNGCSMEMCAGAYFYVQIGWNFA